MNRIGVPLWSDLREALAEMDYETQEEVRKLTAPARHHARVEAVKTYALNYVRNLPGDETIVATPGEDEAAAITLLMAECAGLHGGGIMDPGAGTDRHEAFRECGSGRRQAGDGAAWTAAIIAAAEWSITEADGLSLAWGGWTTDSQGRFGGLVRLRCAQGGAEYGAIHTGLAALMTPEQERVLLRRLIRGAHKAMRLLPDLIRQPDGSRYAPGADAVVMLATALATAAGRCEPEEDMLPVEPPDFITSRDGIMVRRVMVRK